MVKKVVKTKVVIDDAKEEIKEEIISQYSEEIKEKVFRKINHPNRQKIAEKIFDGVSDEELIKEYGNVKVAEIKRIISACEGNPWVCTTCR